MHKPDLLVLVPKPSVHCNGHAVLGLMNCDICHFGSHRQQLFSCLRMCCFSHPAWFLQVT